MCEHCARTEITVETLESTEDELCEWVSEEDLERGSSDECSAKAVFLITDRFVDEHLCDKHARLAKLEFEEGNGDLLDPLDFNEEDIVPIGEGSNELCEFIDFFDPESVPCDRPARFAHIIEVEVCVCEEHCSTYQEDD